MGHARDRLAVQRDPDAVLFLEGPALLEAAETCRREMLNVSTLRLGIDSDLIVAVYRAMNGRAGLKDEAPALGKIRPPSPDRWEWERLDVLMTQGPAALAGIGRARLDPGRWTR